MVEAREFKLCEWSGCGFRAQPGPAGWLVNRKTGQREHYYLCPEHLSFVQELVRAMIDGDVTVLGRIEEALGYDYSTGDRPWS